MGDPAVVIGAGVIGLACAAELARRGRDVLLLEAQARIGAGVSSRSSEVLHGGMYYPSGSLRAEHCARGRRRTYAYCESHGVDHRKCGKLIVAVEPSELDVLDRLHAQAVANGVGGVVRLEAAQARALEPALRCEGALLSTQTGVVDSHGLMTALLADLQASGGTLVLRTPVEAVEPGPDGLRVHVGGADPCHVRAAVVVNAAALGAQSVARAVRGCDPARVPPLWPTKGSYFALSTPAPFDRLIYPVPVDGGLGVHLTLDLAGRARFGPDVEWGPTPTLDVDPGRGVDFARAIRRYWPGLPDGALRPDYAGVRPRLTGPGQPPADFEIQDEAVHRVPGLLHLFGIESPGLTAALSLAVEVADRLRA